MGLCKQGEKVKLVEKVLLVLKAVLMNALEASPAFELGFSGFSRSQKAVF